MMKRRGALAGLAFAIACSDAPHAPAEIEVTPAGRFLAECARVPSDAVAVEEVAPGYCGYAAPRGASWAKLARALEVKVERQGGMCASPVDFSDESSSDAPTVDCTGKFPDLPFVDRPPGERLGVGYARSLGLRGRGVVVGVIDSGIDYQHHDFADPAGKTRVRWYLDYSLPPVARHPELESNLLVTTEGADGERRSYGAVYSGDDLDEIAAARARTELGGDAGAALGGDAGAALGGDVGATPGGDAEAAAEVDYGPSRDPEAHGTHVAGIATSSDARYEGVAPEATIIAVSLGQAGGTPDGMVRAVNFVFERARELGMPAVVNLSLGISMSLHDGRAAIDRALAALVENAPGRIIVVAAGNEGNTLLRHREVFLTQGQEFAVPIYLNVAGAQILAEARDGDAFEMGFRYGDRRMIEPAGPPAMKENDADGFYFNVIWDPNAEAARHIITPESNAAIGLLRGTPGKVSAELLLRGRGRVLLTTVPLGSGYAGFQDPDDIAPRIPGALRATTGVARSVMGPATSPGLIAVGATVASGGWKSKTLDECGNNILRAELADVVVTRPEDLNDDGCAPGPGTPGSIWDFSGAGPLADGSMKPDVLAPGGPIISAASDLAVRSVGSEFNPSYCEHMAGGKGGVDPYCMRPDDTHGVMKGTSQAAPFVTGLIALLLERDPTLTEGAVKRLLQASVRPWVGARPPSEKGAVGEVDVEKALRAQDAARGGRASEATPVAAAAGAERSRIVVSRDTFFDGEAVEAFILLRDADDDPTDAFDSMKLSVEMHGPDRIEPLRVERLTSGLWRARAVTRWNFGDALELRARLDGEDVATPKRLLYVPQADDLVAAPEAISTSLCVFTPGGTRGGGGAGLFLLGVGLVLQNRRRKKLHGSDDALAV